MGRKEEGEIMSGICSAHQYYQAKCPQCKGNLECSFCHKLLDDVAVMVTRYPDQPEPAICDECILRGTITVNRVLREKYHRGIHALEGLIHRQEVFG